MSRFIGSFYVSGFQLNDCVVHRRYIVIVNGAIDCNERAIDNTRFTMVSNCFGLTTCLFLCRKDKA